MAKKTEQMKRLDELRAQQEAVVADLERKLAEARVMLHAYETAIATVDGAPMPTGKRSRQSNVKKMVMEIINDVGQLGVTSVDVVEKSAAIGKKLDRASVSSLLSRLKREGTLTFDGDRYRPSTDSKDDPSGKLPLRVVRP